MLGSRSLTWIGIALLAAMLVGVFLTVMGWRVSKGDFYPHYSSVRTDPLGASGLFESFQRMPGIDVIRNTRSLLAIEGLDGDTALFLLGMPQSQFRQIRIPDDSPVLNAVREKGARLVITVDPQRVPREVREVFSESEEEWLERRRKVQEERRKRNRKKAGSGKEAKADQDKDTKKSPEKAGKAAPKKKDQGSEQDDDEEDGLNKREKEMTEDLGPRMGDRWGIRIARAKDYDRPESGWDTKAGQSIQPSGAPRAVPEWKSPYRFEIETAEKNKWIVAATSEGKPVVVERKLGKGSIAMATDSFFASNESLFAGGHSEFLLWLTGLKSRLVFDETIHGSKETAGVVKTLRLYRLHGFLIGVIFFVVLWAWKSASSLAPGDEETEKGWIAPGGTVSGEDAKSGFVRLLQKSIPGKELIDNCLAAWRGSQTASLPAEKEAKLVALIKRHRNHPREFGILPAYRSISQLLRKKKFP